MGGSSAPHDLALLNSNNRLNLQYSAVRGSATAARRGCDLPQREGQDIENEAQIPSDAACHLYVINDSLNCKGWFETDVSVRNPWEARYDGTPAAHVATVINLRFGDPAVGTLRLDRGAPRLETRGV